MDEYTGPILIGIHDQIEIIDTQMASMKMQRAKLIAARDSINSKPEQKRRGRPPGTKTKRARPSTNGKAPNGDKAPTSREGGPTIRETIMERLNNLNGGDIFQAELGRGLDSGYTSSVLRDLDEKGVIERFKKQGANAVRMVETPETPVETPETSTTKMW